MPIRSFNLCLRVNVKYIKKHIILDIVIVDSLLDKSLHSTKKNYDLYITYKKPFKNGSARGKYTKYDDTQIRHSTILT